VLNPIPGAQSDARDAFERPLAISDLVVFDDMALYTMVKTTTFNGVPLPSIAILREGGGIETLRRFGYEDYWGRLGAVQGGTFNAQR